jgi:hypothetical protein
MAVLVGTTDGYLVFSTRGDGAPARGLDGSDVRGFARGPRDEWLAIVDRHTIGVHAPDGAWTMWAETDAELNALAAWRGAVYAGTSDARVLRVDDDRSVVALDAFADVPRRDEWHAVGGPLQVRSMATTCDGSALLVNVHVGGIPRSVDGGASWAPTIPVDDDVHQVCAHPTRPDVAVAAAAVGLCRSRDGGATWEVSTDGLHASYARGVAVVGDDIVMSASDGPRAARSAVYRAPVDGGPAVPVTGGLPEWLGGNVDTGCIATNGSRVALADQHGDVWASTQGLEGWRRLGSGVGAVTSVAVT